MLFRVAKVLQFSTMGRKKSLKILNINITYCNTFECKIINSSERMKTCCYFRGSVLLILTNWSTFITGWERCRQNP